MKNKKVQGSLKKKKMMGTGETKEKNNRVIYSGTYGDGGAHFTLRVGTGLRK